jgi:hypothetical protein
VRSITMDAQTAGVDGIVRVPRNVGTPIHDQDARLQLRGEALRHGRTGETGPYDEIIVHCMTPFIPQTIPASLQPYARASSCSPAAP